MTCEICGKGCLGAYNGHPICFSHYENHEDLSALEKDK
jgi:hypothetical protein